MRAEHQARKDVAPGFVGAEDELPVAAGEPRGRNQQ
jgi:hypothetical protein